MGFGLWGLKSLYNGKTFKVHVQFPGESPQLFPKLTTVLGRGGKRGETSDNRWRQTVIESSLQCEGNQASWSVEGTPLEPWFVSKQMNDGKRPHKNFPTFYLSFKITNTIAKPYLQKWMDRPLRTREKDQNPEKGLLDVTKDKPHECHAFYGLRNWKDPLDQSWLVFFVTPVFKLMDFKRFIP